jgi:hypothetical protein
LSLHSFHLIHFPDSDMLSSVSVFAFLRLVAATWMCTRIWNYEWCATNCGENQNLEDWCSKHVIAPRVYATSAAVKACAEALRVTVQVENVHDGTCESTHYIVRGAPRVTLLRIESHYEIIYPLPPSSINSSNPHEEKLLPIPSSILAYDRRKLLPSLVRCVALTGSLVNRFSIENKSIWTAPIKILEQAPQNHRLMRIKR